MMSRLPLMLVIAVILSCSGPTDAQKAKTTAAVALESYAFETMLLPDTEWRQRLTSEAYQVLREKGTERPFTHALLKIRDRGTYVCAGCALPLFHADTKFDSGTGWPSFYAPAFSNTVAEEVDRTHGMVRTEVLCARCDGHLGHVFPDGPQPTGLRYCINGLSLAFVKD